MTSDGEIVIECLAFCLECFVIDHPIFVDIPLQEWCKDGRELFVFFEGLCLWDGWWCHDAKEDDP
jgi:hypothetical protein